MAVGDVFAGCRVEEVIGRGGMGVVYKGVDLTLERPVAIKLIAADRATDDSARRRFEREARLMASIDHPNVIPVYAAGEQDGHLYLVMRYVDGTDLQRLLREKGPLEPLETARIIDQIAKGLDAAHARGLVHRDIKPANVMLSGDHVYLTDFGITRLTDEHTRTTETGDWVGTVEFMSPEHLRGEATDARSDTYSLGCVLYACLTGVPPFKRPTTAATIAAQLHDRPPAPSATPGVSRNFDGIVLRALAKEPKYRYASAGQMGAAALLAAEPPPQRRRLRRAVPSVALPGIEPEPPAEPAPEAVPAARAEPAAEAETSVARTAATRLAGEERTAVAGADAVPTLRLNRDAGESVDPLRARTRRRLAVLGATLLVLLAALVAVLALHTSKPRPLRPLTRAEVMETVDAFALAYGHRDRAAMAQVLAPHVMRVDATGEERGSAAVLADYRQQFATKPVPVDYRLSKLIIIPGWVARVAGTYTLTLKGGDTLSGTVTFAVQRVDDRLVIGLIATQQNG